MYTPRATISKKDFVSVYKSTTGRDATDADFETYVSSVRSAILAQFRQLDSKADETYFEVLPDYEADSDTASDKGMMAHLMAATHTAMDRWP